MDRYKIFVGNCYKPQKGLGGGENLGYNDGAAMVMCYNTVAASDHVQEYMNNQLCNFIVSCHKTSPLPQLTTARSLFSLNLFSENKS